MHSVEVDPGQRTARVQGGATWGLVDAATHEHGLATPSGIISTTGVGGLTLGGGHGYLSRKYGLTIDNLLEAEVVLANGRVVTASESEYPDLFWALRGGGGNFGIVTSFTFRLHPVGNVVCGPTAWPVAATKDVLSWFRDFLPTQDDDLYGFFAVMTVPPVDTFPEAFHLHKVCAIMWCYLGDPANATEALKPVRDMQPAFDGIGEAPYPGLQSAFDGLYPRGLQWYWRGDFFGTVPDAAVDAHARFASELPTMHSTMHLYPIDGAVNKVARRGHRLGLPRRHLLASDRRGRPGPSQRRRDQAMDRGLLGRHSPILSRRGVRELHDGRGPGPGASHLRRQLRPPRRDQGHLRPDQLVPDQPEHPARWLRPSTGTTRPTYKRKHTT